MAPTSLPGDPGTYVLTLFLPVDSCLQVGRLGDLRFERGYYYYVGSALGGLRQRVGRHLRQEKTLRWHIDFLLQAAQVVECWFAVGRARRECAFAHALAALPHVAPGAPRFGSSDCACPTHLFFSQQPLDAAALASALGEGVPLSRAQFGRASSSQENTAASTSPDQMPGS